MIKIASGGYRRPLHPKSILIIQTLLSIAARGYVYPCESSLWVSFSYISLYVSVSEDAVDSPSMDSSVT